MIRFGAIGLAWSLLTARLGTWLLATLAVGVAGAVVQGIIGLAAVVATSLFLAAQVAGAAVRVVPGGPSPLGAIPWSAVLGATTLPLVAAAAAQGALLGGLFRMALRQLDGHEIRARDALAPAPGAGGMAAATTLLALIWYAGTMALIVPGLVGLGLSLFALPLVVDGRMGGLAAVRRSWGTLRADWLPATLFVVTLGFLLVAGVMLLGAGLVLTLPLCVLATAAQYRRSFAPGAVRRPDPIANPVEAAAGVAPEEQSPARVPAAAWGLLLVGLAAPVVVVGGFVLVTNSLVNSFRSLPGGPRVGNRVANRPVTPSRPVASSRPVGAGAANRPPGLPAAVFPPGPITAEEADRLAERMVPSARAPVAPPVLEPPPEAIAGRRLTAVDIPPMFASERLPAYRGVGEAIAALGGDPAARKDGLLYLLYGPLDSAGAGRAVVRALFPLLSDPKFANDADWALVRWATPADVPFLIGVLDSPEAPARDAAITFLGRFRANQAADRLAAQMVVAADRKQIEATFRELDADRAEGAVRKYLKHPELGVRITAENVLTDRKRFHLDDKITVAIADMDDPKIGNPTARNRMFSAVVRLMDEHPDRRPDLIASFRRGFTEPSAYIRCSAVNDAIKFLGDEANPYLARALDDPDRGVKQLALNSFIGRESPANLPLVAPRLDDPDLRDIARELLRNRKWGPGLVPALIEHLERPDPETRRAACIIFATLGPEGATEALQRATEDPIPAVAEAARNALHAQERRSERIRQRAERARQQSEKAGVKPD